MPQVQCVAEMETPTGEHGVDEVLDDRVGLVAQKQCQDGDVLVGEPDHLLEVCQAHGCAVRSGAFRGLANPADHAPQTPPVLFGRRLGFGVRRPVELVPVKLEQSAVVSDPLDRRGGLRLPAVYPAQDVGEIGEDEMANVGRQHGVASRVSGIRGHCAGAMRHVASHVSPG